MSDLTRRVRMRSRVRWIFLVGVILLTLAAMVTLTSAAEKKPITFVTLTDLTGPAHAQVGPEGWATEDYFTWLNKNGGIDGHPVAVQVIDTKYQLPLIRSAYSRVKDMKQVCVSFDAISGGIEALRTQFAQDKIPVSMYTGHAQALYPVSWVMGTMPPYDDVLATMADWIMKNWKENRKPRLALFLGNYAAGRAPELAKWYCEKKGVEIVAEELCPLMPTDTSDLLIRIRDAKPDFIFDTLMPDQLKVVLKDKHKLSIKIPQVGFVFNCHILTQTVPPEAYDGYMGFQAFAAEWEKDVPGIKFCYELFKKRGEVPPGSYIIGVCGGMVMAEAVKNALKKVGYDGLNGEAIRDGYMQIKNFTAQGIYKEISYSPQDVRGCKWLKIAAVHKDGTFTNVTEYMEAPWNLKLKTEAGVK
jgi:branched-chain amino acid transport system substrate-binding protein